MKDASNKLDEFVQVLATATINHGFYPRSHPSAWAAVDRVSAALQEVLVATQKTDLTLLVVDHELVIEKKPWRRGSRLSSMMVGPLSRAGVDRVSFAARADRDGIDALLEGLCGRGTLESTESLVIGKVILLEGEGDAGDAKTTLESRVDAVLLGLAELHESGGAAFGELERAVWRLLESLDREPRRVLVHRSATTTEEQWRRHAVNTLLYTVALGRAVGAGGTGLFELAFSGLLHDVGLWSLPHELWLAADDWTSDQMRSRRGHVDAGAAFLAGIEEMPALPILVAREHHLSWDGRLGYPRGGGRPNLASQIVAVADQYDSITQANQGLEQRAGVHRATSMLAERAETTLQPELVSLFLKQLAW